MPTISVTSLVDFLSRRDVIATLTVVPATYWYWHDLVASLDSVWIAALLVGFAWLGIATNVSEAMTTGRPHGHHHEHHDYDH